MNIVAVIDADVLAYRCAAANEGRSIRATHRLSGQVVECPHRTSLKEQIKDLFDVSEFDIEDVQTEDEIANAYHAMDACIAAFKKSCDADSVELYISGDNNFRDSLPLPTKYKSNRTGLRPKQLKACREWLIKRRGAVVIHRREVDDMLAQRCYEGLRDGVKTIAVTNDGDQLGVAGWCYNWTKHSEPRLIKGLGDIFLNDKRTDFDGHGRKFLYAQWVYGDWNVDRFKPSELSGKKFGVVSMYSLLKDCKTDAECVQAVYNQYKKWYPGVVEYTDWTGTAQTTDVIGIMQMYIDCAHMQRWEGDRIIVPTLLGKLGVNYQ